MGTVFLACEESGAHPLHREAILSGQAAQTALTQGFTGRLARGINNELLQMLNEPGTAILPYPLQRVLMRSLALNAQKADRSDLLALWAGQSANLSHCAGIAELLQSLVEGAAERLNRV
jgi:nitronate monooxygenase